MAVQATAVWRVRPSGSNTNGGGYDSGISGAATDYSQQDAAQATGSNLTGTTATVTDLTANNFTSAMVGNAMYITGGGATTGWYFIITFTSSSVVVLDRSPGAGVTNATWALGGGWADFWTNTISTGPIVAGNTVYILGSGTPNPASYTYDYTASTAFTALSFNASQVLYANDPGTPGYKAPPDTTGGMPVIKVNVAATLITNTAGTAFSIAGLWFVGTATAASRYVMGAATYALNIEGCVLDQFSFDVGLVSNNGQGLTVIGCEVFSSAAGSVGALAAVSTGTANGSSTSITGCNLHDCIGIGVLGGNAQNALFAVKSIIAKCQSDGINVLNFGGTTIQNCTIDGNLGNGIKATSNFFYASAVNCIISNHNQVGKFGITAGTSGRSQFIDYNTYYNNTSNYNNVTAGPHDTALGSNPYIGQSTENYGLA